MLHLVNRPASSLARRNYSFRITVELTACCDERIGD
jgi:hypothetical protein